MGNDKTNSNIIALRDHTDKCSGRDIGLCEVADVSDFIVDMLDTLMKISAKKDQSLLVYFLAMARIEAMEMKNTHEEENRKS